MFDCTSASAWISVVTGSLLLQEPPSVESSRQLIVEILLSLFITRAGPGYLGGFGLSEQSLERTLPCNATALEHENLIA